MIRVKCPACEREFELPDFLAGLSAVCKNCRQPIPVPAKAKQSSDDNVKSSALVLQSQPPPQAVAPKLPEPAPPVRTRADSDMPGWESERARALLESGMNVTEIEKRLIAEGLPAETATAVVDKVLHERVRRHMEPVVLNERRRQLERVASAIVAALCIGLAYYFRGPVDAFKATRAVLFPVICIWFSDAMGGYTSKYSFAYKSIGIFIRGAGWVLLILIAAAWTFFAD